MLRLAIGIAIALGVINLGFLIWQGMPGPLEWRGFYATHNPATLEGGVQWWPFSTRAERPPVYRPPVYDYPYRLGSSPDDLERRIGSLERDLRRESNERQWQRDMDRINRRYP